MDNDRNNNLTANQNSFLTHMMMWGSAGYPVAKVGRKWVWQDFYGIPGAPTTYRTKREAFAAVEAYVDLLIDYKAGRIPNPAVRAAA